MVEAIGNLRAGTPAERSRVGIALAVVSLVVMPLLSRAKRQVARGLSSGAMHADARQTEFCTYLSAILLGGLLLNSMLGLWWADSAAALLMTPIIAREGIAGLRGRACCD
jgi:divalent metal cation (Fe/Co/Zn/Cd) transporter